MMRGESVAAQFQRTLEHDAINLPPRPQKKQTLTPRAAFHFLPVYEIRRHMCNLS